MLIKSAFDAGSWMTKQSNNCFFSNLHGTVIATDKVTILQMGPYRCELSFGVHVRFVLEKYVYIYIHFFYLNMYMYKYIIEDVLKEMR